MSEVIVYSENVRVGKTNNAFDVKVNKELMRGFTLDFGVTNLDPIRPYVININAMYEVDGQKFDMTGYTQNSGSTNLTLCSADHVSYRTNNYTVPAGFTHLGTVEEIITALIAVANAEAEFSVGSCADIGDVSFIMISNGDITLRAALWQLTSIGVEVDYDNFTINAPVRIGADTEKIFRFGRDLVDLTRTLDKSTTPYTYSYQIEIANLQAQPGGSLGDEFVVGDTISIMDAAMGDSVVEQRIIGYMRNIDDPSNDNLTIGMWIPDFANVTSEMQVDISSRIKENTSYNNVSIDRINGFKCIRNDNGVTVKMNAIDGFVVLNSSGDVIGGITSDGYLISSRIQSPDSEDFYGIIGKGPDVGDEYGLFLFKDGTSVPVNFFSIFPNSTGGTTLETTVGAYKAGLYMNDNEVILKYDDGSHNASIHANPFGINFKIDGVQVGYTGEIIVDGFAINFKNGLVTSAEII